MRGRDMCAGGGRAYLLSKRKGEMRKNESGEPAGNRLGECMGNRSGEHAGGAREKNGMIGEVIMRKRGRENG